MTSSEDTKDAPELLNDAEFEARRLAMRENAKHVLWESGLAEMLRSINKDLLKGEVGLKSTIPWSSLSGGQAIPAAIFGLRSVGVLFASGLLRIASVQRLFLNVMVNIISSQVPCGLTGNCCEQSYTSTIPNRSQKAQMIEWRAIQTGGGKKCGWWTWYKCS